MATFEERINQLYREFRVSRDYPNGRTAFAKSLGISKGQLSGWLDGVGSPDFETLKQISFVTDISVLWLIGVTDERISRREEIHNVSSRMENEVEHLISYLNHKYGKNINIVIKDTVDKYLKETI